MKFDIYKKVDGNSVISKVKSMPADTVFMLEYIKKCNKIGIRNDKLYNYRIRKCSVTYEYNLERFPSALGYREVLIDFFKKNDVFDAVHRDCVNMLFLYFIDAIISIIMKSDLSAEVKISEALKVFKHEVVQQTLKDDFSRNKTIFLINVKQLLNQNVTKLEKSEDREKITEFFTLLSPKCGKVFDYNHISLYIENPNLWNALLNDEIKEFIDVLLNLIMKGMCNNIDLSELVMKTIPENTIMSDIESKAYFYIYPEICIMLLNFKNTEALNKMTGILFSGNELNCPEDFLNVYIKLAALENHVEAFLFGNIQKAYLYIDEKRCDEAKSIVNDLVEMGAGDNEDVIEIQKLLEK